MFGTLRQYLSRPKDAIDPPMRSGVVYSIPCANCNYTYIGETGFHLSTRIKQHRDAVRKGLTDRSAVNGYQASKRYGVPVARKDDDDELIQERITCRIPYKTTNRRAICRISGRSQLTPLSTTSCGYLAFAACAPGSMASMKPVMSSLETTCVKSQQS